MNAACVRTANQEGESEGRRRIDGGGGHDVAGSIV